MRNVVRFCILLPFVASLLLTSLVAATSASAQTQGQWSPDPAVDLLSDALDAISDNDPAWLAELVAQASDGTVWIPEALIVAMQERDAETLVLGIDVFSANEEELEDLVSDFIDYERELVVAVRDGEPGAAEELTWAETEGQAMLSVVDLQGLGVSDEARQVLGPIGVLGGVEAASLATYDEALDQLEEDGAVVPIWLLAAIPFVVAAIVGTFVMRGRRINKLANADSLTGLANRRRLDNDIERRRTEAGPTAVLMIDVDHFKRFNDTHGHAMGDEVLRAVGQVLSDIFRSNDVPYRYGGEEFCVLLSNATAESALAAGERARAAIESATLPQGLRVTASVGVAVAPAAEVATALEAADHALYAAKEAGRNRVSTAPQMQRLR